MDNSNITYILYQVGHASLVRMFLFKFLKTRFKHAISCDVKRMNVENREKISVPSSY